MSGKRKIELEFECPCCGKVFNPPVTISPTKTRAKKETIPREALTAVLSTYLKCQGKPFDDFNRKIHSRHAKQLWIDMDKDVQACLRLINLGSDYATNEGWSGWSWKALKEHKDNILSSGDNNYGW